MNNLERYKDEFVYMLNDVAYQPPVCNYFEKIWAYSDCSCCPFCTKDNTVCDYQKFVDWLLAEHKEPIKLTQFEYDLLEYYTYVDNSWNGRILHENYAIRYMCDKGYLKNVDLNMTFREVLDNCEVEDR